MLTKEQYEALKDFRPGGRQQAAIIALLDEYDSANPPKPVAVPCSVCGSAAENLGEFWRCLNSDCTVCGPNGDNESAAKWNKLHGRCKLPIKPPFFAWNNKAYPVIGFRFARPGEKYIDRGQVFIAESTTICAAEILGDPIDLTDWF